MAFYTALEKQHEDSDSVTYKFGPGDGRWGLIKFDKQARDYHEIVKDSGVHAREPSGARDYKAHTCRQSGQGIP